MAIGKWISFTQSVAAVPTTSLPKPIQIPCPADGKQFGLENFGNTCYANSVLQALYFCSPFRELVTHYPDPYSSLPSPSSSHFAPNHPPTSPATTARRKPDRKSTQDSPPQNTVPHPPAPPVISAPRTLFSALRALYTHVSQNPADKGTIAPRAFIEKLRELNESFRNTMHHDAHEFLNYLLNRIVEDIEAERRQRLASGDDLPRSMISSSTASHPPVMTASASTSSTPSPGATFIHQIFEGTLTSETRCLTCENASSRDESFLDLSIDIEQNSSVTACLRQFSASEMLCQKEKFFCDACCDLQEAERRMKIKRLPNVLALHLKRFKYQEDVQKYIKLTYRVAFPFELRLFNTVDDIPNPDRLYELFAIVVHIGNGPNHGHYVSIIKTMGNWLIFDDDTVDSIKECDIPKYFGDSNSGSAYVLYYQAVDIDLSALGLRQSSPEPVMQPVPQSESPRDSQLTDSPLVAAQSCPPLPPGLADDLPSSTPGSDPLPQSATPPKSPRKISSQFLKVSLGRSAAVGHGPSRSDAAPRLSQPVLDDRVGPTKPSLPPITIFPKEDPGSLDSHPAGAVNGKERDSDKGMMRWLRRRSFKNVKSRPSSEVNADVPPLPQGALASPSSPVRGQSTSSSSNSSKDSRRPLDSPTPAHPPPRVSSHPNGKLPPSSRTANGSSYGTPSRHSSVFAISDTAPTAPSSGRSSRPRPLPPIPPSPQTPNADTPPNSPHSSTGLVHNRTPRRHATTLSNPQVPSPKSPGRPATSVGAPTRASQLPFGLPSNGDLRVPGANDATSKSDSKNGIPVRRPKSALASYGVALSPPAPPIPPPPLPVKPTGGGRRQATRKLSFSAPMLGFGKRDKDKH